MPNFAPSFLFLEDEKRKLAAEAASLAPRHALGSATADQLTHIEPNFCDETKKTWFIHELTRYDNLAIVHLSEGGGSF